MKQIEISPGYIRTPLQCQNDQLDASDRTIWSCYLLPTCSMLTKTVTVSVAE